MKLFKGNENKKALLRAFSVVERSYVDISNSYYQAVQNQMALFLSATPLSAGALVQFLAGPFQFWDL